MPPLDPASTAALIASLQARTDDGAFSMTSVPTTRKLVGSARSYTTPGSLAQQQMALRPAPGEQAFLVSYAATYRWRKLSGEIIVGANNVNTAQALLAIDAQVAFDAIDRRMGQLSEYAPKRGGP